MGLLERPVAGLAEWIHGSSMADDVHMIDPPDVLAVRRDPERHVGPLAGGTGLDRLVLELAALAAVETFHAGGPVPIRVALHGPREASVEDGGRGMRLDPDAGDSISHVERAMTSIYPVACRNPDVQRALEEWLWGARGSLGPVVVSALSEELVLESRRGGRLWRQVYRRGRSHGRPRDTGPAATSGTTIRFQADPEIFSTATFDPARIARRLEELRAAVPGLDLTFTA